MGYKVTHGRIKEKYNPLPNASEARHESRLRELPCFGCGGPCQEVHHTRLQFIQKRFRRDHRYQLPLCKPCHDAAHEVREADWLASVGKSADQAIAFMTWQWHLSEYGE